MNEEEVKIEEESTGTEEVIKRKNVFTNKNFTLVFLGALVSNIASLFYSFAVSFYILKITDNNALIQGLYLAVSGIVFGVVTLFGGVISDRFNKAKIMYICDYVKGAVIIGFTFLLMFVFKDNTTSQVIALFVIAVISNAIAGIFTPASSALLPIIVEEDSYQQAQSYFSILSSFQSIIGVILAGVLYALVPINVLFLIVGVCYLGSGFSEMFIKYDTEYEKHDEKLTTKLIFKDIGEGFKYLFTDKALVVIMILILFLNFFIAPIFDNYPPYFIATEIAPNDYLFKDFIKPEMWSSFFSVAFAVGSLVTAIVMSIMKPREKYHRVIKTGLALMAFFLCVLTVSHIIHNKEIINLNALLIITTVIFLLMGVSLIIVNVPTSTSMMKIIDKDKMGKVTSVMSIGSQGLNPVAMFLGGIALSGIGSNGLLIMCTSGIVVTTLIAILSKSMKRL